MLNKRVKRGKQWMANLIALLMVSVYMFFSVGILKATHFCMGREASVSWFTTEAEKCACSLYASEKESCCDDEHELIRIDNDQKIISGSAAPPPEWISLGEIYTVVNCATAITAGQTAKADDSPPPKVPRWKKLCSLVFYDDDRIG